MTDKAKEFTNAFLGYKSEYFDLNFDVAGSKSLRESLNITSPGSARDGTPVEWELNSDFSDVELNPDDETVLYDGQYYGTPAEWLKELTKETAKPGEPNFDEFLYEYAIQNDFTTVEEMLTTFGLLDGELPEMLYKLVKGNTTAYAADLGHAAVEDEISSEYYLTELLCDKLGLDRVYYEDVEKQAYRLADEPGTYRDSLTEANFITNAISGPGHIFKDFYVRAYRDGKELVGPAATGKAPRKFTDFGAAKKYAKAISTNIDGKVVVKSGKEFKKPEYEKLNLSIGGTPMANHQIVSYTSGSENPGSDFTGLFTDAFRSATKAVKLSAPSKRAGEETEAESDESTKPLESANSAETPPVAEKPQTPAIPPESKDNYTADEADREYKPKADPQDDPEPQEISKDTDKPAPGETVDPTEPETSEPSGNQEPVKTTEPSAQPVQTTTPAAASNISYNGCVVYVVHKNDGSVIFNVEEQTIAAVNGDNNKTAITKQKATQTTTNNPVVTSKAKTGKQQTGKKPHRITPEEYAAMTPEQQADVDKQRARWNAANAKRAAKKAEQSAPAGGIKQTANTGLRESYSEDYDMTFEELNDNFEQSLRTPGVYGVEIVGEDCTLFPTEVEARDYFDSLSLDDFSPDCEGIQLFIVTDTAGSTEVIDNKSVYDDLSDEEFLEAFGAALKDKHDQKCTNCSSANFNDDTPKFGDFNPGDEFSAFDDFDTETQSDETIPDEWDELPDEEDEILTEEFEDNAVVPCKNYKVVAHCDDEKPVCGVKKPLEEPLADKADFTKDLYEETTSATKVDTSDLGAFDKAKEGPLWKVCDVLNTKGKVVIKNMDQLQKVANYIPIYQKTAADGTRLNAPKNSGRLFNSDGSVKQIKADPVEDGKYSVTLTEAFGNKKEYYRVVGQETGTSNPAKKTYMTANELNQAKETFSTICKKVHAHPDEYIANGHSYCVKLLRSTDPEFTNPTEINSECVNKSLKESTENVIKPLHYDASELGKNLPPFDLDKEGFLWDNCFFLAHDGKTIVSCPEQAEAVIDYIPVFCVTDPKGVRYCQLGSENPKKKKTAPKRSKLTDADGKVHRDWFDIKELGHKEYQIKLKEKH